MKQSISLEVNGESYKLEVSPNRLLLDVLRDDLGLTGARRGCVWSVHRPSRLPGRPRLLSAGAAGLGPEDSHYRGPSPGRKAPSPPGGLYPVWGYPVRLLHSRHDIGGQSILG